jgi:MATE family multidrug resistance protein
LISNHRGENRKTLALAFPIVAGFLGQMLMGLVDTVMVGWVGVLPLAACAFANTILSVPLVFGFGLLSSVSVRASHAFGSGNPELAGESLRGGILLSLLMGGALAVTAHVTLPFLHVLGQPPEVNHAVGGYFLLCAWSFIPIFITGTAKNVCESLAKPWPPFWIMIGAVFLNVFLNWIFIFGNMGSPAMGLTGAGLATLLSRIAAMLGVLLYCSRSLTGIWPKHWLAPGFVAESRRLFRIGIHSAGLNLSEVTGFSIGSVMMGWLGMVPLAAHQIALSCAATTFMVPLGIGQAVSVRVSQARGSGNKELIRPIIRGALGMTVFVMSIFAAIYLTMGNSIADCFVEDAAVRALTVQLLALAGIFQIFDGLQIVSSGALRGFADTKVPFLIGMISYWALALPTSWVAAFPLEYGARGIWFGFVIGLAFAAAAMGTRVHKKIHDLKE